jgi:Aerobic-type carbon monoxide dehydrogenase, large subunit CoxL/CutL homologs
MNKFPIKSRVGVLKSRLVPLGHGKYVSDIKLEGSLTAYILRSPHAHAKILSIDVSLAKSQQGVHLILTGEDYQKAGLGAMPYVDPPTPDWNPDCIFKPEQYGLATNIVRYVGDIVALVIAENIDIAQDAANLIDINYEILEPNIETEFATSGNKPPIWSEAPNNISFTHKTGDISATDKAFSGAKYVITRKHVINRVAANSMEARAILASYNGN